MSTIPIEDEIEPDFRIENVVATASVSLEERLDLMYIKRKIVDTEYNPERFPGLVLKIKDPRATFLIFSTGKMVITGLRTEEMATKSVKKVFKKLKKIGVKLPDPEIIIQNIVASGDLHLSIDLNMAAIVMDNSMYEPEVFPGLIYRVLDPYRCVFLIFSTGRIVCTGTKSPSVVETAVKDLNILVRDLDLEMNEPKTYENITFI